jgi:Bacterial membrane protein YfhO
MTGFAAKTRSRSQHRLQDGGRGLWLSNHQTVAAALVFAVACVVYLFPVLVGGHVLSPAAMLYSVAPWASHADPVLVAGSNSVLSDHPTAFHPWLAYARLNIRAGDLPTWSPYQLAGTPFLGNAQATLFSPFSLPAWILPLKYAFGVQAALRLWIAALGAYLWARELRLRFWPAVVSGLSFGFAPFLILWLSHPHTNVIALAPWVLWRLERVLQRGSRSDVVWLAIVVALTMLGGHPGSEIHVAVAAALYGLVRVSVLGLSLGEAVRRAALAAVGGVLGVMLAMVALLPAYLVVPGSSGVEGRAGGGRTIPLEAWRSLFFPDWWGRPSAHELAGGPDNYNERTLYAGAVGLALAVIATTRIREWRRWIAIVVLGLVGVVVPLGIEPFHDIAAAFPPLSNVQNARLVFLTTLAVAMLAGFGAQYLADRVQPRLTAATVAIFACGIGILGLIGTHASLDDIRTAGNHFRTGTDFPLRPAVVELTTVGWWVLLAGGVLVAALAAWRGASGAIVVGALVILIVLDLGHFARGYQPMPSQEAVFAEPPPTAIRVLQQREGQYRSTGLRFALPPDSGMVYGLHDIRGHDPPEPDRRYLALFRLANPAQPSAQYLQIPAFTAPARRVMDILGVRYIIDDPGRAAPGLPGVDVVYRGDDATIFRNAQAAPQAYVPSTIIGAADAAGSLRALAASSFRAGRDAVVETSDTPPPAALGRVKVVKDTGDEVDLIADLSRGGLVVLNDALKPGWSVSVDGADAEPVRVNSVVRGVVVPAGRHRVSWHYDPPGLIVGIIVSLLAGLILLITALWPVLRRRRSSPARATDAPSRTERRGETPAL